MSADLAAIARAVGADAALLWAHPGSYVLATVPTPAQPDVRWLTSLAADRHVDVSGMPTWLRLELPSTVRGAFVRDLAQDPLLRLLLLWCTGDPPARRPGPAGRVCGWGVRGTGTTERAGRPLGGRPDAAEGDVRGPCPSGDHHR